MKAELLERLLHESECTYLDFKRDHYPFPSGNEEIKSELLKDILALANAERQEDGYLLIGVEEVRGGRATVRGVSTHLNDHDLQQFVSSKVNRPITLSYEVVPCDSVHIGVIHIPAQERFFFLKNDFGKLRRNLIYYRLGSSTREATPDELLRWGRDAARADFGEPELFVQFAVQRYSPSLRPPEYLELGDRTQLDNLRAYDPELFEPKTYPSPWVTKKTGDETEELISDIELNTRRIGMTRALRLAITNRGPGTALNVEVGITVPRGRGLFAMTYDQASIFKPQSLSDMLSLSETKGGIDFRTTPGEWQIRFPAQRILPGHTFFAPEDVIFGATETGSWDLESVVYGDNLSGPKRGQLQLAIRLQN